METADAVLLSQVPLVVMAVLYYMEFLKIRKALEDIGKKVDALGR